MGYFDSFQDFVVGSTAGPVGFMAVDEHKKKNNAIDANNAAIRAQVAGNSGAALRDNDFSVGMDRGKEIFYNDLDMKDMRARRESLSKGYDSQELGSLRNQARGELEGQRSKYIQAQHSQAARAGVGGARAAAMEANTNANFAGKRASQENQINMDQAKMVRQGTGDLQDFMMRQKYGQLGTALGEEQLGVADRTAANQLAISGQQGKKGLLGDLFDGIF